MWDFKKCQIATDETSSSKTHPPTNVEMTFLVATLVCCMDARPDIIFYITGFSDMDEKGLTLIMYI